MPDLNLSAEDREFCGFLRISLDDAPESRPARNKRIAARVREQFNVPALTSDDAHWRAQSYWRSQVAALSKELDRVSRDKKAAERNYGHASDYIHEQAELMNRVNARFCNWRFIGIVEGLAIVGLLAWNAWSMFKVSGLGL